MTEAEIIVQANEAFGAGIEDGSPPPTTLLEALELFYGSNAADAISGDGNFYRVHRWIVWPTSREIAIYDTEEDAIRAFNFASGI